MGLSRLK